MRVRDLGPLTVEVAGREAAPSGAKLTAILSMLVLHANQRVSTDSLVDAVWGADAGTDRLPTLESHIWRLRRILEPARRRGEAAQVVVNDNSGYRFVALPGQIDSARFERLGEDARECSTLGDPLGVVRVADEALALWRGRPHDLVADHPRVKPLIARLTETHRQIAARRVDALLQVGDATIEKAAGAPMGFLGPVAIKIPLAVDRSVAEMPEVVVGGNKVDVHLTGVVPGRDFALDKVLDLRDAVGGDPCPRCGQAMVENQGIEVGHVFKLGTKYSKAMGAHFLDDKGHEIAVIMGCYGIGVNRIVAAAVEAGHDANGIVWPSAPRPLSRPDRPPAAEQRGRDGGGRWAREASLEAAGYDVLVDDRDQRPGVKFKDADLIGIPLRVVISERGLKDGTIEVKWRTDAAAHNVSAATAGEAILAELAATRKAHGDRGRRAERSPGRVEGPMTLAVSPPGTPLPRLPFVLLGLMTAFTFGGPLAIGYASAGGAEGGKAPSLAPRPARRVGHAPWASRAWWPS